MKFKDIRAIVGGEILGWITGELCPFLRETIFGLRRLSFEDNFESFEYTGDIAATTEVSVPNRLGFIPSRMLVVDVTGGCIVSRGPTAWTKDRLFIKNYSASSTRAKVVFMR